jgi:hypothetical protein
MCTCCVHRYCLAPYGWGWGIRLTQMVLLGCVPVVIQPHVFQPFEDVLDYDAFSVRLPRWVKAGCAVHCAADTAGAACWCGWCCLLCCRYCWLILCASHFSKDPFVCSLQGCCEQHSLRSEAHPPPALGGATRGAGALAQVRHAHRCLHSLLVRVVVRLECCGHMRAAGGHTWVSPTASGTHA